MSTIAVSGAAGVVGSVLVEHLAAAGHTVVALDHRDPPPVLATSWAAPRPGAIIAESVDIRDGALLEQVFRRHTVTAIIHMAAVTAGPKRESDDPEGIADVNINGALAVLRAARACSLARIVHVSSNAVYGAAALETDLIDERLTSTRPTGLYGVTKLAGEGIARRMAELWGLDVRIARLSSVFGPFEHATGARDTLNPIFQATVLALEGKPALFTRPCVRDWIYNRDVAAALEGLVVAPKLRHPVYNISPGPAARWSVASWCELLAARFPGFEYSSSARADEASVDLHEPADRAPMANARLVEDTGFQPSFDRQRSFDDLMQWLEAHRAFWTSDQRKTGGQRSTG